MPTEHHGSLAGELEEELRGLEAKSQRRSLCEIAGVNLCSNDYLGLAEDERLRAAVIEAVREAPRVGGTGSRLLSGHLAVWDEVESEFADFVGSEAALYFGSGYAANVGLLSSLMGAEDVVFCDELNHASLIDGARLSGARKVIYPHLNLNELENALRESGSSGLRIGVGRKFVVTETVFSMDGDVAPLREMVELCARYGANLIVDEAHATAVHGSSGRGIAPDLCAEDKVASVVFASVHTCSKALASAGAFVCGGSALREHLINRARTFIFSTAMPPYMAKQIQAALRLARTMDETRTQLMARAQKLRAALRPCGLDTGASSTQIVPVLVGGNEDAIAAAEYLQQRGFAVRAIRPPTVKPGQARLRLSIMASIGENELERLAECLGNWRAGRSALAAAGCA
jgi:8-amino-7-oxononanoate synthase